MKKKTLFKILLISSILIFVVNYNQSDSLDKFYQINSIFSENYKIQEKFKNNVNKQFINDTIYCSIHDNLQEKIYQSVGKTLILGEGIHNSYAVKIPSNIKIIVPKNTTIKLSDDYKIDKSMYSEAEAASVIQCIGKENNYLENIFIELNGTIDGNKSLHTSSNGGVEGIDFKWVKNSYIYGNGSVINANGDGLDIDVSNNCYIEGISFFNNDGAGVHFGSPRPIKSNFNNLVVGCTANSNGFINKRSGFDQSWPNINGVTYLDCKSENNFQNWDIKGTGSLIIDSNLHDNIPSVNPNYFDDALYFNNLNKSELDSHYNLKINKSGYYFISIKNRNHNVSLNFKINGIKLNGTNITSENTKYNLLTGIYFFNKNDILTFFDTQKKSSNSSKLLPPSVKLDLIVSMNDFYPKNYGFKILTWRVKSEIKKVIYNIYSFLF